MSLTTKVKVAFLNEKSYKKQLLTSISVDMRIYLPLKVIIHLGLAASVNYRFSGCLPH